MFSKVIDFVLREVFIHFVQLATALLPNSYIATQIRGRLIGWRLGSCGKNFRVASGLILNKPGRLHVGDNVYIAHNVWINAVGGLSLGSESVIGPFCVLATSRHVFEGGRATHKAAFAPISVGEGAWLASHVVVTDGVEIGAGSLVAAGAVVTGDVPEGTVAGGVPAKVLGPVREG